MAITTTNMQSVVSNPPVSAPGATRKTGETSAAKVVGASSSTSESKAESTKGQDRIELSAEAFRLAQTRKNEEKQDQIEQLDTIRKLKQDVETEAKKVDPEADKPETDEVGEDSWQQQRNAKLDRLETMVRQGLYKVDPFMLDVLAIRMVRMIG